jgi:hypothetical protein
VVCVQAQGERERERGEGGICSAHAGVQNTPRLKLETKTPVGLNQKYIHGHFQNEWRVSGSFSLARE